MQTSLELCPVDREKTVYFPSFAISSYWKIVYLRYLTPYRQYIRRNLDIDLDACILLLNKKISTLHHTVRSKG